MKKLIIILLLTVSGIKVNAQTLLSYADTANYLKRQIENRDSLYEKHPLSVLMDSLKLKPVRIVTDAHPHRPENFGKSIRIYFNRQNDFSKTHFIVVYLTEVPPQSTLFRVFYPSGILEDNPKNKNLENILATCRPLIVNSISIKDYMEDDPVNPNVHQQY